MGIYKTIIDYAQDLMCVVSPDIQCQVLYINKAARCALHSEPTQLLGSSFWNIVNTEDKMALFRALITVSIFTLSGKMERVLCRVGSDYPGIGVSIQMAMANGMEGIVCVMCNQKLNWR